MICLRNKPVAIRLSVMAPLAAILTAWGGMMPPLELKATPDPMMGAVQAEICEQGLADKDAWPEVSPRATESFQIPAFGLDTLPQKYVDDGVRGTRPSPSLLRLKATVTLPAGNHRFLIRSRSAARLSMDGKVIAETPFPPKNGGDGSQAGSEILTPLDLGKGYRFAPAGEYEKIEDVAIEAGAHAFTFEVFVGGREGNKPRRVELGETVVALSSEGQAGWELLSPSGKGASYSDVGWEAYRSQVESTLAQRNASTRAALREKQAEIWKKRRDVAAQWLASTPETKVPALPEGLTATSPIDHFLAAKLLEIKAQNSHSAPNAVDFFRDVRPLLESRCLDCHRGNKAKGGLQLDTLANALRGGDSGPAIVPGQTETSEVIHRITTNDADEIMPPKGKPLTTEESAILTHWIQEGASWPELPLVREEVTPPVEDLAFLRRVTLDTIGLIPTVDEARSFLADASSDKRARLIDRLLGDDRWADHWISLWLDVLAENPNILNPTLNNTGPFRWWLQEALLDDLPMDRMVTQLLLQRGGDREGGPAGFGQASQNDSPFAAKGTVISAAFLGVDMKCARCHDSPSGSAKQEQLFQLGALLASKPLEVPKTSSVDPVKLHAGGRKPLIEVTLMPGTTVQPEWPFQEFADPSVVASLTAHPGDHRERLAALITAPQNERFAQVIANRIWQRLMGRGIVDPVDNWEKGTPSHPELLRWLGRELVRNGYQVKPLARLILTSQAYQRSVDPTLRQTDPLHTAPEPRRLSAEQVVDSLFAATGKPFRVEPVCLDLNGRRDTGNSLDLGRPHRSWMLASLSNERDRPSLMLPRLQAVADVLSALGWRGSRQDPLSVRDLAPNALQPAILANGSMSGWLTRLSDDNGLTELALKAPTVDDLIDALYLRLLTRRPSEAEKERTSGYLREGFDTRKVEHPPKPEVPHVAPAFVTWTNHLLPQSNTAKEKLAEAARKGDPPTTKLEPDWRQRCEDVIWALINSPEMLYRP